MMNGGGETSVGSMRGGGGGGAAGRRCEDCGNQAKRECRYWRCRRCCNRRKLECQTHVSSTWVPTSLRRLQQATARGSSATHLPTSQQLHHHHNPSDMESDDFPREVTSMATFHCCKVASSMRLDSGRNHGDDDRLYDEYAYRTSVSIGGHLFKGILYDQGPQNERRQSSAVAGVVVAPPPPFSCTFPLPTLHTE